jgi:hypothetical protein
VPPPYGAPGQPYGYGAPAQPPGYGIQPPGYGIPAPGYPYAYPGAPPPKKSNRTCWILGGLTSLLIVAALVVCGMFLVRGDGVVVSSDEAEIKQLVEEFSAAGNTGKFADLGQYFCKAEAGMFGMLGELGEILQGIEIPQNVPTTDVTATDIEVKGDVATAKMGSGGPFDTAYFRKEAGEWKVCMSAGPEFSAK